MRLFSLLQDHQIMQKIQVFNTLTGKKEDFVPIDSHKVTMYACGPTVYMLSHLGHARMAIVWDVVQRYLRFVGYEVTFVRNITDVDDKIIARAKHLNITAERLARQCTYDFWHDMAALNVQFPDHEPRATEYIKQMIDFVQGLINAGHAYVSNGDVYFDVASFKDYGKLGKQNLEQLMLGARDQVIAQEALAQIKKNPVDFALWKSAGAHELHWQSPWGPGRPGWHLECSTMVKHLLGTTIDIHAGGEDLVFPHHENEIAQSEALHCAPLARYWLHNSFVQVSAEKMSKSLGNFKTIRDLLEQFSADTIRLFVLQTHYRNPIDFTLESLHATRAGAARLLRAASYAISEQDQKPDTASTQGQPTSSESGTTTQGQPKSSSVATKALSLAAISPAAQIEIDKFKTNFADAMNNDFNTAIAISSLFQLADQIFQSKSKEDQAALALVLIEHSKVLGLTLEDTRTAIDTATGHKLMELILTLRQEARGRKDYASADLIRKTLTDIGINVMDTSGGVSWERN
jgi:cysteinyl-tRNA synthetase